MHKSARDGQLMEENYEGTKAECGGWEQRHWALLAAPLTFGKQAGWKRLNPTWSPFAPFPSWLLFIVHGPSTRSTIRLSKATTRVQSHFWLHFLSAHTHPWFHPAPSTSHFLSFFKRKVVYIFAKLISVRWCFSLPTSCSFNLRSCVSDVSLLALVAFTWAFLPICLVVRVRLVQVIACAPLPPSQSFKVTETMKLGLLFFSLVFFLERISVDLFRARLHSSSLSKFICDIRMKGGCAGSSNRIGTDPTLDLVEELLPSYFTFASSFMSTRVGVRRTDWGNI